MPIPRSLLPHPRSRRLALLLAALALLPLVRPLCAQSDNALSDAEVEQIRTARYVPSDCIVLFTKFLDLRIKELQDLYAKPRRPGREEDTRDLLNQLTSIADELSDNLDDYGPRHADLRKALPKVIDGADRWASAIKSPPEDETYAVARKIALESIRDLRESATELSADQVAWFKAHPPSKDKDKNTGPIDIPR
jgi:hypothetical protein